MTEHKPINPILFDDDKTIDIGAMDAAVVIRQDGEIEVHLPNLPGDTPLDDTPKNVLLVSMSAVWATKNAENIVQVANRAMDNAAKWERLLKLAKFAATM